MSNQEPGAHRALVRVMDYQQLASTRGQEKARGAMKARREEQSTISYTVVEFAQVQRLNVEEEQAVIAYYDGDGTVSKEDRGDRLIRIDDARREIGRGASRARWHRPSVVCESCLEAIAEEAALAGLDDCDFTEILLAMGDEIPDHICEWVDDPQIQCGCRCTGRS